MYFGRDSMVSMDSDVFTYEIQRRVVGNTCIMLEHASWYDIRLSGQVRMKDLGRNAGSEVLGVLGTRVLRVLGIFRRGGGRVPSDLSGSSESSDCSERPEQ